MRTVHSYIAAPAAGLGALMLVSALSANASGAEPTVTEETRNLAASMNKLGGGMLGGLAGKGSSETVVLSPYGLGSALHLLSFGASGKTQEILRAKLLPAGFKAVQQVDGLITLNRQVLGASRDKLKLTMASAVFYPKSAKPWSQFVGTARGVFDATPEALDFADAAALERINSWAKKASNGLIPQIVEQLDAQAPFVLANVVYFNGAWETAFEAARTAKAPFTRVDGSKRDVAMMDATMPAEFAEFDDLRSVWLPYAGREIAMLVIAPGEKHGPATMAQALKSKSLVDLMAEAQKNKRMAAVQVRLPRFRTQSKLDVTDALSDQGLGPAFSARANYNAINRKGNAPLQVTHRAVLEVSESGTKAAAATAITSDRSLAVTPVFSADRPFAIAIVHRPTDTILFAGYIADPGDDPGPAPAESKVIR